jgi:hypothetical protein
MQDPSDLVDRVKELLPYARENKENQHVVSRVLLRRFTRPTSHAGAQLEEFDLTRKVVKPRLRGVGACGRVLNFIPFASSSLEDAWGKIETPLGRVLPTVDDGTVFDDPRHVAALRDAVALHFVRSLHMQRLHQQIWTEQYAARRAYMLGEGRAQLLQAFYEEHGIHLPPGSALDAYADQILSVPAEWFRNGAILRAKIEDTFEKARRMVASAGLEILVARKGQFLLGDTPALTVRKQGQRLVHVNALGDANTVILPLGPHAALTLAREHRLIEVPNEVVTLINVLQIRAAAQHVYARPGAEVHALVDEQVRFHRFTARS